MDEQMPTLAGALVGRDHELSEARAVVEAALAGAGGLLLISGEAGIGKTRLVEALTADMATRTLWGTCLNDPGTPAFWLWTTVLRDCSAAMGLELSDDLAPVLGPAESATGPAQQLRLRLFDSVASYLREATAIEPLVIVLEDLHFADTASLELLRFLAVTLRGRPVAIVGTHRYPDLEPGAPLEEVLTELQRAARAIVLHGLGEGGVGELIQATTGIAPSTRLGARVRARTGGNPLFVTEVARLFAAREDLDDEHIPIPPRVQQVIAHRLSYISSAALDVLAAAAVAGQVFSESVLARVTGQPPGRVADLLDEAAWTGLVQPLTALGQFRFAHALVRDVLYAGTPASLRRTQHRLIAETIEALHPHDLDDHVDKLADHYVLALPDADAARALAYSRRAGNRALGMLASEQAARHFRRAVDLAERAPVDEAERIELLLALGDAQLRAGDWQAATVTYEEVAASARRRHRPDELARAALGFGAGLSGFEVRLFDQRQLDLLREALDELGDGEPELRAWMLARLSVAESYLVTDDVRVAHSKQALELARRSDHPKLLTYALSSYCDAIPGPGQTDHRLELADAMVQLGVATHDAESELLGRRFRLVALLESGDITGVDAEIEAFALTAARLRWPLVQWYPLLWRGMRALIEGRLDDAERLGSRARDIGRRGGSVNAEITVNAQRLQLLLDRGLPGDAYELLNWFIDDPEGGPNAEAWLVLPLTRMGRHAEARAVLDRLAAAGFPLVMDGAWLEVTASVAEGCAELGHVDAARILLPLMQPYAERFATGATGGICFGSLSRHLGLLAHCCGELDESDAYFGSALAAHRRAGATLLVAHTLRQHASLLLVRDAPGDRTAGEGMLEEANSTYRELGLDHWLQEPVEPRPDAAATPNVFRREGDVWTVRYRGHEARIRHAKGLPVLARLLAEPSREYHVFDLAADTGDGESSVTLRHTGAVIDAQAREAYRRRLADLEADIDNATTAGDLSRVDRAQHERDALVEQLTAAYGLGGRVRRTNDPVERARSTVTKQIRTAIARIETVHPSLAAHLRHTIKTGRYCSYTSEHPVTWEL